MSIPKYQHDCEHCVYLGHFNEHDLYYHPHTSVLGQETVVARYGSDERDYDSGLDFARNPHTDLVELRAAYIAARDLGLTE